MSLRAYNGGQAVLMMLLLLLATVPASRSEASLRASRNLEAVDVPASSPLLEWYGRTKADADGFLIDWPGVSIHFKVSGTEFVELVVTEISRNAYRVFVDGLVGDRTETTSDQKRYKVLEGLDPARTYEIEIMKVSEGAQSNGLANVANWATIHGLSFSSGYTVSLATRRDALKLEFVGDGLATGEGVLTSPPGSCTSAKQYEFTDTAFAYSSLLCREMDADCRYTASAGRGLWRNRNGDLHSATINHVYQQTLLTNYQKLDYNFRSWVPDAIIITTGEPDFTSLSRPKDFKENYKKEIRDLTRAMRGWYSSSRTWVFVVCGPGPQEPRSCPYAHEAVAEMRDNKIVFAHIDLKGDSLDGCNSYPTKDLSAKVAASIRASMYAAVPWPEPVPTASASPSPQAPSSSSTSTGTATATPAAPSPSPSVAAAASATRSPAASQQPSPSPTSSPAVPPGNSGSACSCTCFTRTCCRTQADIALLGDCPAAPASGGSSGGGGAGSGIVIAGVLAGICIAALVAGVLYTRHKKKAAEGKDGKPGGGEASSGNQPSEFTPVGAVASAGAGAAAEASPAQGDELEAGSDGRKSKGDGKGRSRKERHSSKSRDRKSRDSKDRDSHGSGSGKKSSRSDRSSRSKSSRRKSSKDPKDAGDSVDGKHRRRGHSSRHRDGRRSKSRKGSGSRDGADSSVLVMDAGVGVEFTEDGSSKSRRKHDGASSSRSSSKSRRTGSSSKSSGRSSRSHRSRSRHGNDHGGAAPMIPGGVPQGSADPNPGASDPMLFMPQHDVLQYA